MDFLNIGLLDGPIMLEDTEMRALNEDGVDYIRNIINYNR